MSRKVTIRSILFLLFIPITFHLTFHTTPLHGSPFLLEQVVNLDVLQGLDTTSSVDVPPDPVALHPQWWTYFNVTGEDLTKRINTTNELLQKLYVTLPLEDQAAARPHISKITTSLNALPFAKKQEVIPNVNNTTPFLKAYSLEKQIDLSQQYRKLQDELKNEIEHLDQLKERLSKTQKNVDNLMVGYMAQTQPSSKKVIAGLEIMNYTASAGLGEQNVRLANQRIAAINENLRKLDEELDYAKEHLDVQQFDRNILEKNMALAEKDLELARKELFQAESVLLASFTDNNTDRNNQFVLEQQVLRTQVNRAYTWMKLAFHTLKYNIVMQVNKNFSEGQEDLRKNLRKWHEEISTIQKQVVGWKNSALKNQDRIRQEYTSLIARQDHLDASLMSNNQLHRQEILNVLATLELLHEESVKSEWLVNVLETHFSNNSGIFENGWVAIHGYIAKGWEHIQDALNYSLFKVSGIPITLLSLIKIIAICAASFWISRMIRLTLFSFGKRRGDFSEPTLHTLGGVVRYIVLFLGLVIALYTVGFDFSSLIFVICALLFGISFGLQSMANNFFSGLRILFERKINIGDDIVLHSGQDGKVTEIHIQNTVVCTTDGQKVIVPNSEIIGNVLGNWTKNGLDYRRLHIPFAVAADCDKDLVRKIVIEAAKHVSCTLKSGYKEPQVWLIHFDRDVIKFELVVWVDHDHEAITCSKEADFLWEIETALRKYEIPLPSHLHELIPVLTH